MSVVVAIKENGKIYLGADSQVTQGSSRASLSNPNNYKIWKVGEAENCFMAHVGLVREGQLVKVNEMPIGELDIIHDAIDWAFVVRVIVPFIQAVLMDAGLIKEDERSFNSSFLFAYRDRLFSISYDGCVLEVDDFVAIGSGSNEAKGSLLSTVGKPAEERIVMAIKASAASDIYVDYPIILVDTESQEFHIIKEEKEEGGK